MNSYLIAGLGNIGPEYELTRHNIGFLVLDRLADLHHATFATDRLADLSSFRIKNISLHLIKPSTFMNLSGKSVRYWLQELKIASQHLLVVVDDIALPFGSIRIRAGGSSAGHNGLRSIETLLEKQDYPRLRIGIGSEFGKGRQAEYVLSSFSKEEFSQLPGIIDKATQAIESFCSEGIARAMTQYNQ